MFLRTLLAAGMLLALAVPAGAAKPIKVKLATLAPDGSPWHELLKDLAAEWNEISEGRVQLKIFAGGVAGDEPAVMKKLGINNYQAALITSHGLSSISRSTRVFSIPLMLRNDAEVENAIQVLGPGLEVDLEERGYVILAWAYAGWVSFFVPKPETSVNSVRKLKLFTWAGDPDTAELWDAAGFTVVPLPATDLLTGLKTKLINAFDTTPVYALTSQAYRQTPYMIQMNWAPLTGALVLNKKTWEKIPEDLRSPLMESSRQFGQRLIEETKRMEMEAMDAMRERGLTVVIPSPDEIQEWNAVAYDAYPKIRGKYVSAEDFDELQQIAEQFRSEEP